MRILCLEQGDWVKPTDYPSNGRDWEARLFSDFAINPNRRARPTDYPINDANSPIKVVNFNGVGGSTIMYTAHFPRLHPSDFKVRRSTASPTTGRSTTPRWSRSSPRTTA
jgi:choline dehydrogenase-like flavoprotein